MRSLYLNNNLLKMSNTTLDKQQAIDMGKKPKLGFWEIWNMSFGFLGIQMGFALQIGNTSWIFQKLGSGVEDLAIYWLAGPITGLLVQPVIGYFSDRTWHPKLGRRRPYFLVGAILAAIALILMPNSPVLWMAIGMLWIMDSSFNISMEPFRAFVGDKLPSEQRTLGFATQSFFIGTGAVIASLLPYILTQFGVENTAPEGIIPPAVKWSFYIGGVAFLLAVLWTVFKSTEYSPEEMAAFAENSAAEEEIIHLESEEEIIANGKKQMTMGGIFLVIGLAFLYLVFSQEMKRDLYVLGGVIGGFGLLTLIAGLIQQKGVIEGAFVNIINDLQFMPKTMKQLSIVQFFSWFALFAMWIYTTPAITEYVYGTTDADSQAYGDGASWVGVCFAVYNGVAAAVAFLIPVLAKATSRKMAHMICLTLGGISLISIFFIKSPTLLLLPMVGVGIAWSSILSMPYAILTGALPSQKLGYYMGVFNFFIVLPQIVAASVLGWILTQFFETQSIWALVVGGASMIFAGIFSLFVNDVDEAL